eukprot:GEMP01000656.1.p1 GENE.GEMP01000656.1~~GEMP01000656.1.p1  ORF type:complete len:1772 (+),score=335.68 GEMP01000656.1:234-5549(+)
MLEVRSIDFTFGDMIPKPKRRRRKQNLRKEADEQLADKDARCFAKLHVIPPIKKKPFCGKPTEHYQDYSDDPLPMHFFVPLSNKISFSRFDNNGEQVALFNFPITKGVDEDTAIRVVVQVFVDYTNGGQTPALVEDPLFLTEGKGEFVCKSIGSGIKVRLSKQGGFNVKEGGFVIGTMTIVPSEGPEFALSNAVPCLTYGTIWDDWKHIIDHNKQVALERRNKKREGREPVLGMARLGSFAGVKKKQVRWNPRVAGGSKYNVPSSPSHTSKKNALPAQRRRETTNGWTPRGFEWVDMYSSKWPTEADILPVPQMLVALMEQEFQNDCRVMYNTIFPRLWAPHFRAISSSITEHKTTEHAVSSLLNDESDTSSDDEQQGHHREVRKKLAERKALPSYVEYGRRIIFLKRLFLCLAYCGLRVSTDGSESNCITFSFPLAACLSHGSRMLFRLEEVHSRRFCNFLVTGTDEGGPSSDFSRPLKRRLAATHAVVHDERGELVEKKLNPIKGAPLFHGFLGKHAGLDIPLGGVANPGAFTFLRKTNEELFKKMLKEQSKSANTWRGEYSLVGLRGDTILPPNPNGGGQYEVLHAIQGGHVYIRVDDFGLVKCVDSVVHTKKKQTQKRTLPIGTPCASDFWNSPAGILLPGTHALKRLLSICPEPRPLHRMESMPNLRDDSNMQKKDLEWIKEACTDTFGQRQPPPSEEALEVLLRHFHVDVSALGKGDCSTLRELYQELKKGQSELNIDDDLSVKRRVDPVVMLLTWNGFLLKSYIREFRDADGTVRVCLHDYPIESVKAQNDTWLATVKKILSELGFNLDVFTKSLWCPIDAAEVHHRISYEAVDDNYLGLLTNFVVHLVRYSIKPNSRHLESMHLPVDERARSFQRYGCDFNSVRKNRDGSSVTTYWRWDKNPTWPMFFSTKHKFPARDKTLYWVANARETGGVLTNPHSEEALNLLLLTTGIDVPSFGVIPRSHKLGALYQELQTLQCGLIMKDGKPLRLIENLFICLIWKEYVLVQTSQVTEKTKKKGVETTVSNAYSLIKTHRQQNEEVADAALRCLKTDVFVKINDVEDSLERVMKTKFRNAQNYQFFERVQTDKAYPGLNILQRIHFIKFQIRPEVTDVMRKTLPPRTRTLEKNEHDFETTVQTSGMHGDTKETKYWTWLDLTQTRQKIVHGIDYINIDLEENHVSVELSSVMIGVEGSAPRKHSPFGHVHDASGKSGVTAAAGGRKWRAFRKNQARQIPADFGGMRLVIGEENFNAFQNFLDMFQLQDPSDDVLISAFTYTGSAKWFVNKRQFEKEFFQKLLSSGTYQAGALVMDFWEKKKRCIKGPFNVNYIANGPLPKRSPKDKSSKSKTSPSSPSSRVLPTQAAPISRSNAINVSSVSDLRRLLSSQPHIKLNDWRKSKFSAMDELFQSIQEGNSWLVRKAQLIIRRMDPVYVQLIHKDHVLVHDRTVINRMTIPQKRFIMTNKKANETPHEAGMLRLKDALNVNFSSKIIVPMHAMYRTKEEQLETKKYPTLPSIYNTHFVFFEIMEHEPFHDCGLPKYDSFSKNVTTKFMPSEYCYKWYKRKDAYAENIEKFHPDDQMPGVTKKVRKGTTTEEPVDIDELEAETKCMTLHGAAHFGNMELMTYLLNSNGNINAADELGEQPFHVALLAGQTNIAHMLIERKADVNAPISINRMRPLHLATSQNYSSLVDEILKRQADVDMADYRGQTALHLCASKPQEWKPTLETILLRSPTPELQDRLGRTALFIAQEKRNAWVILRLNRYT